MPKPIVEQKSSEKLDNRKPDPCIFVMFGASGDLAQRMLIPALYHLAQAELLPDDFAVIGFSRKLMTDEQFRELTNSALSKLKEQPGQLDSAKLNCENARKLVERFYYVDGDLSKIESYHELKKRIDQIHGNKDSRTNVIFYLATPPDLIGQVSGSLAEAGLTGEENGYRRVVIEKPFGRNLESAKALNSSLCQLFKEDQIYRIDHYLGKEMVQNIMVFRFANGMFEPTWNRRHIDSVQITVAETLGVEHRAAYYEKSGALRDMVGNHLFQILSLVAMEPPTSFSADDVRDEEIKVLKSIKPLTPENVAKNTVRGQYCAGRVDGTEVQAYRSEPGVEKHSETETYFAMKLELDNWRWAGVPFYLRTGKRLSQRVTEVAIQLKCAPFELFREVSIEPLLPNFLVMRIQPDEGITLSFCAKAPGPTIKLRDAQMTFEYEDYLRKLPSTGYETLLYDCMRGDKTLFRRADQVEQSWQAIMPILNAWDSVKPDTFPTYSSGSAGPNEASDLLKKDGRSWRQISGNETEPLAENNIIPLKLEESA